MIKTANKVKQSLENSGSQMKQDAHNAKQGIECEGEKCIKEVKKEFKKIGDFFSSFKIE